MTATDSSMGRKRRKRRGGTESSFTFSRDGHLYLGYLSLLEAAAAAAAAIFKPAVYSAIPPRERARAQASPL